MWKETRTSVSEQTKTLHQCCCLSFIYGIKSKTDRSILKKIKNDYLFAEYRVYCEEAGRTDVLDYLDELLMRPLS